MKRRILGLVLISALTVSLAACGNDDNNTSDTPVQDTIEDAGDAVDDFVDENITGDSVTDSENETDIDENATYSTTLSLDEGVKVYLVASPGVYDDNGKLYAMGAEVYLVQDNENVLLDTITGDGTAYPISYDDDGIYVAGSHRVSYYEIENGKLVLAEEGLEEFDSDGNASYTFKEDGVEEDEAEKEYNELFTDYQSAKPIEFQAE